MPSLLTVTSAATLANRRLCTLAAVKAELDITVTTYDTALTALIDDVSASIASHCKRVLAEETVRETWRCVDCAEKLILARWPVSAVSLVSENGVELNSSDWELDGAKGFLWRLRDDARCCWSATKVVVDYTAGWRVPDQATPTLPGEISRAAVITAAAWRLARGRDPMLRSDTADGVGGSSWIATADMGALPPQAETLLAPRVARSV